MRGDPISRRVRNRAWSVLLLLVLTPFLQERAPGQDVLESRDASTTQANDSIDLAARRIEVWQADGVRWIHLVGKVAILQGVEGPRGDEALARLSESAVPGGIRRRLDFYIEGSRGSGPAANLAQTFTTDQELRVQPYDPSGFTELKRPPANLPIFGRSGFAPRRVVEAKATSFQTPAPSPKPSAAASVSIPKTASAPTAPMSPSIAQTAPPVVVDLPTTEVASPPSLENAASGLESEKPSGRYDPLVLPVQDPGGAGGLSDNFDPSPPSLAEPTDAPSLETDPGVPSVPSPTTPPTGLEPLPDALPEGVAPPSGTTAAPRRTPVPRSPFLPGTQRVTQIFPRTGSPNFKLERLVSNGTETIIIRGGVRIVTQAPAFGIIELASDSAVIWRKLDPKSVGVIRDGTGKELDDARQPMEFYLEGDVVVKQDERKVAGNGDQKTYRAKQAYYDLLTERFVALDAELFMFAPGLVAPTRILSPRIEQYRPFSRNPDGSLIPGLSEIRALDAVGTGSRFPTPGYRFRSKSIDINRVVSNDAEVRAGVPGAPAGSANDPDDLTWNIDARQNVFFMGMFPTFYWPRFKANADDLEPPLRMIIFRSNNYFGQQLLTDWNGFRVFQLRKPKMIDQWNLDLDYLSARTKSFPALGSEIGWSGRDLLNDLYDPYQTVRGKSPTITNDYFGYFDIWGLRDFGRDILGSGPAIITNNVAAGNVGYQRGGGGKYGAVPPFQDYRGKLIFRHMQRFLPDDEDHLYEDLRMQLEVGYSTDRYFIEEYYKRLNDVGLDQETLAYVIKQKDNTAFTAITEGNLQPWNTESQWLPKLDYYRLGDSLLGNRLSYFQNTGIDYANTHTAVEVNNPHLFAFLPYDPISNTSGTLSTGRAYTNHELDLPLNFFDNVLRIVPYAQGQLVGWNNQINGSSMGRAWGAIGARAEIMAWKAYPWMQSEILNIHGINHKINFEADFRDAFSNQNLNSIGVQDDLDDNSYEGVRRYFAMTNYAGGVLPSQYDPRFFILRNTLSPIAGTTDIQSTIETLHLGVHQRLQTKRGPEGRRRIIDYMTLDLDTTYFPNSARDNFNKPFGLNTYNYQWFIGDRTSILSYGWFEFFNIGGTPIYNTNTSRHNDPFGLNVITTGISISRPPRGNIFIGYSVIDTGPITTSALNSSLSYWLAPKWYGSFSTSYDVGNAILLGSMFSVTRIGADYLSTVGLSVDPQRQSYMFSFTVMPRLGPGVQNGSAPGLGNFDPRYAPTQ